MPISMHPSIATRIAIREGLRARVRQATAGFYQKPGVMAPPVAPLYIVTPLGFDCFEISERATGKVITKKVGHNNATSHARVLEAEAKQFDVKLFGRFMRNWTLRISAILAAFVFFGSHL